MDETGPLLAKSLFILHSWDAPSEYLTSLKNLSVIKPLCYLHCHTCKIPVRVVQRWSPVWFSHSWPEINRHDSCLLSHEDVTWRGSIPKWHTPSGILWSYLLKHENAVFWLKLFIINYILQKFVNYYFLVGYFHFRASSDACSKPSWIHSSFHRHCKKRVVRRCASEYEWSTLNCI